MHLDNSRNKQGLDDWSSEHFGDEDCSNGLDEMFAVGQTHGKGRNEVNDNRAIDASKSEHLDTVRCLSPSVVCMNLDVGDCTAYRRGQNVQYSDEQSGKSGAIRQEHVTDEKEGTDDD